jgi:hypothetical protein
MIEHKCLDPREIQAGDLVDYLHGDASPQVVEHVARCPFCSAQVEQLRVVDAQLLAAFYRDACPTPETLADFVLNQLPAPEKLRVAAHVRRCAACTEEVASVRDLSDEGPSSLLTRLREALALAQVARPVQVLERPVRGTGWRGRFEIDDLVITLSSEAGRLTGRVRRRDAQPDVDYSGMVWLLSPEMETVKEAPNGAIDERGRFQLTGLATGSYELLLQIDDRNVTIDQVRA